MVLIQFDLTLKAKQTLEAYMAYTQKPTKADAINSILEELDLDAIREEYFEREVLE